MNIFRVLNVLHAVACPQTVGTCIFFPLFKVDEFTTGICENCRRTPRETIPTLLDQIRKGEARLQDAQRVCASCASTANAEPIECINIDCPWLFDRKKAERRTEFLEGLQGIMEDFESLEDHCVGIPNIHP